MNFEEAMKNVDDIIAKLSQGDIPLEQAIELYKDGSDSLARCRLLLDGIENELLKVTYSEDLDNE